MAESAKEATSLKQLFQGMVPDGTTIVVGTVVAVGPVKIRIENDDKLIVTDGRALMVPWHLTDYETKVTIQLADGSLDSKTFVDGSHSHSCSPGSTGETPHQHALQTYNIYKAYMMVHNALKVGEVVYLLKFNNGKNYLALDRRV